MLGFADPVVTLGLHHRLISGRPFWTQTHLLTCGETNDVRDLSADHVTI
jgi:hypothetical protein